MSDFCGYHFIFSDYSYVDFSLGGELPSMTGAILYLLLTSLIMGWLLFMWLFSGLEW